MKAHQPMPNLAAERMRRHRQRRRVGVRCLKIELRATSARFVGRDEACMARSLLLILPQAQLHRDCLGVWKSDHDHVPRFTENRKG